MKILVGYDGSNVAKAALELARRHATTWNAKIEVVNCMHQNQKLKYEDIRKVEENLEDEVHAIMNSGAVPYQTYVLISDLEPGEDLVQFAEENKIDEIVIGIRKRSKVGKLMFGSTGQYVILNAPCPVVSIK
ncbi:MAG: universal stress protein [Desulfobacteraceae bacterium]|jgi:nucleotide-binding universal stress UspA family protein|nr:universal stress protein [Desulfobacteraceae bacterium]